jgi:hypothetical protein
VQQIGCRLVWALGAKRSLLIDPQRSLGKTTQIFKKAQAIADASPMWRTPTYVNFLNLIVLGIVTSEGDLTRSDSRFYFEAAAAHFRNLFRTPDDLIGGDGAPAWGAYRFAIIDCQRALELGNAPLL